MEPSLSRAYLPVTILGPGRRLGIWFQDCSIHCPSCISADTWGPGQRRIALARLFVDIQLWLKQAEGITAPGGEPFEQSAALLALPGKLRQRSCAGILAYSGYPLEYLRAQLEQAAGLTNAPISDSYQQHTEQSLALHSSDSQRLSLLTDLGRSCLGGYQRPLREDDKVLDLMLDHDDSVWMTGTPRHDDLLRLRDLLREQGHQLSVSAHRPR